MATIVLGLGFAAGTAARAQDPAEPAIAPPAASDEIFWYPAPSRCTFFTPERRAAFRFDDPDTWRFVFLVMAPTSAERGGEGREHAYVMVDGVLRELEKVRSGADSQGRMVTVWRSAGEPRVNVTTTLAEDGRRYEETTYSGWLTMIRGNGQQETAIVGACGA